MKLTKLKIAGQTGNVEKSWCWYSGSKRDPQAEFYLPWGKSVFFLLRPSTDWMRPTHIMNGNLLYSKSAGGVVQSLSHVQLFAISWTAAQQVAQTHVLWVSDAIQPTFSVTPFSCPHSFPASGSFPVSWLFASGGQRINLILKLTSQQHPE